MDARGFVVLVGIWELKEDDSDAPTDVHVASAIATIRAAAQAPRNEMPETLCIIFTRPFDAVTLNFNRESQYIRRIHSTIARTPVDSESKTSLAIANTLR